MGCAGRNADSVTENSDKELAEEFNKDDSLLEESTGSIGFGYVDPPQNGYVYDGTELEVPYYIENTGGLDMDAFNDYVSAEGWELSIDNGYIVGLQIPEPAAFALILSLAGLMFAIRTRRLK